MKPTLCEPQRARSGCRDMSASSRLALAATEYDAGGEWVLAVGCS
jgi:hypothetical protein